MSEAFERIAGMSADSLKIQKNEEVRGMFLGGDSLRQDFSKSQSPAGGLLVERDQAS